MKFGIGCFALAIAVANLRPSALAFTLSNASLRPSMTPVPPRQVLSMSQARQSASSAAKAATEQFAASSETRPRRLERALIGASAVAMSSIVGAAGAIAEYVDPDDVGEIVTSDLPPMWVPLAVGFVLTVGISLLQGSLGDVMNDEAKLGSLSGARAAKQSARDRNMFKKKQ